VRSGNGILSNQTISLIVEINELLLVSESLVLSAVKAGIVSGTRIRNVYGLARRLSSVLLVSISAVSAFSPVCSQAQSLAPNTRIPRIWEEDSGLPHGKVCALVQSRDGYLWLGTPAGLVRFDGVRFEVYSHLNTPLLENSRILSLCEDGQGVLWIGTDGGGLYSYAAGTWKSIGDGIELVSNHIRAIAEDSRGDLWVGTEYGLHRFGGEGIDVFGLDEGLADNLITALAADDLGRVWAGTMRGGLARFEEGFVQIYDYDDGLHDLTVLSLAMGADGRVWIGTMHGLFYLDPEEGVVVPVDDMLKYPVTAIATLPDGRLLVGTMIEGLKVLGGRRSGGADDLLVPAGGRLASSAARIGDELEISSDSSPEDLFVDGELSDSYVCSILSDREGFVWVGTESQGLVQLKERRARAITERDGLPGGSVYSLLEDADGTLWIGTEKSGLIRMREGDVVMTLNRDRGLAGDMVRALMKDDLGTLWVGTMDGGLSVIAGAHPRHITPIAGLSSDNVTAILEDDHGAVWVGTDNGLSKIVDGEIVGTAGALEGRTIRTLYESPEGVLHAGTRSGVWRMSGGSFERIIASNDTTAFDALFLYEDSRGAFWAGTNGGGLKRISDNEITTYSTEDGLPGNFVFSIREDDSSLLWMSCESGVFSVSLDSLEAYADGSLVLLAPTLYNDIDGVPSSRCSGFCQPSVCVSRYGEIYYPTDAGIAVFDSEHEPEPPRQPVPRIEAVLADDVPMDTVEGRLPSGTDRVEIRFTAFDYAAPERLRFLYKLERIGGGSVEPPGGSGRGGSEEPSARYGRGGSGFTPVHPGRERSAVYQDLSPGEYEFRVRAISNDGSWSEGAATARFVIVPPFHRTRAFLFLILVIIAASTGAAALLVRYRRLRREQMKYSTTSISGERMEAALTELITLIEEERIYLDPDITLQKLAKRLKIHYNHLSRIINERFGMSFKNYINRYRVEEAKRRLADPAERDRNILDIMYDSGFYSKSTFNTAFRKFTGTSPSEYRKRQG
jgi:ligand-binding sensor domain-containing protein/AraC-like DNA-binding protein